MSLDQSPVMPGLSGGWRFCELCKCTGNVASAHFEYQ